MKKSYLAIAAALALSTASINVLAAETSPLNLNTATKKELVALPGIGQKKAEDILAYREQHHGFKTIEELTTIKGINQKMVKKLSPSLTLGSSVKGGGDYVH